MKVSDDKAFSLPSRTYLEMIAYNFHTAQFLSTCTSDLSHRREKGSFRTQSRSLGSDAWDNKEPPHGSLKGHLLQSRVKENERNKKKGFCFLD